MKYWEFKTQDLIADFDKNKRTLASVLEALGVVNGYVNDPANEDRQGELEAYKHMLELRRDEYEWYVDMVVLGMNQLPEVERLVLRWWLIDRRRDAEIVELIGCGDVAELNKIKRISLRKFVEIIMP